MGVPCGLLLPSWLVIVYWKVGFLHARLLTGVLSSLIEPLMVLKLGLAFLSL